jgi:uncharacterized protein (UPF0332 family)
VEPSSLAETQAWLRRAYETLAAAEVLAREAYRPEALSRCYYSMFYAARALLVSRGIVAHKHSAVLSALGREFARTGLIDPALHRAFVDAFSARQRADYLIENEPSTEEVERRLAVGREFVRRVEEVIHGLARPVPGQGPTGQGSAPEPTSKANDE